MEDTNTKSLLILMLTLITTYLFFNIYQFYSKIKHYPHGPKPLPFIGNLHLLIAHSNRHYGYLFKELAHSYGDLYTFWLGSKPVVVINEIELAKQAFNQNECSDRFEPHIFSQINDTLFSSHNSFGAMNMNAEFKIMRKVSIEALRKFLSGNTLSEITHKIVDNTVIEMKSRELGKSFVPFKYIDSITVRILFEVIFNKPLHFENHKIEQILRYFETFQLNFLKLVLGAYIPLLKVFLNKTVMKSKVASFTNLITKQYRKHNQSVSNNSDSLCNSHIIAENHMKSNDESKDKYLTESNTIGNLQSFLFGGSDTSHYQFKWILLLMAYFPEMQKRMRHEISSNIGNKVPDKSDREKCDFVNAFICETMRYRSIGVIGLQHMTSSDTKIGNALIPIATILLINQISILNDHKYWKNPDMFNPQRFLDSEQHFITAKMAAFVPFSIGKRMCPGERFAMNMLFLVLTRLLQTTDGMMFELQDKQNVDLESKRFGFFREPKMYKIRLVEQNY